MALASVIKSLFVAKDATEKLTVEEIRRRIFEAQRNMEMRNREAASAEKKAQEALQKTFQPGIGQAQRTKLLAEYQRHLGEAKSSIGFANQLGGVLETLESAETFLELSETISQSDIAGAGKLDVHTLMKELQDTEAILGPMISECQKLKHAMDVSASQFDELLTKDAPEGQDELMALYAKYDAEPDPVKKAAIQAEIQKRTEKLSASVLA